MSQEESFTLVKGIYCQMPECGWHTSTKPSEETQTTEAIGEESGEPVQLMLHDIRASALNSSLENRVISKSELHKYCFKDGVLENSSIHSPVFISDILPEYLYSELEQMVPTRMSKFTSPDESNISEEWRQHLKVEEARQKSWTEWALELIGWK